MYKDLAYPVRLAIALFGMARPLQLVAVTLVYILGTLIAGDMGYAFNGSTFAWGYAALIPVAASIHYMNEYADYETDLITKRTPFSGGSGAMKRTGIEPEVALVTAWLTMFIGLSIWITAISFDQIHYLSGIILFMGGFFGWMYSVNPLRLAWRGLGEIDNAALGGILLPLYGFIVQSEVMDWDVVWLMLPFGLMVFLNLLDTTWADRKADRYVGKLTLATRFKEDYLVALYIVVGLLIYIITGVYISTGFITFIVFLSTMATFPVLIVAAFGYTRWHTPFPTVFAMVLMLILWIAAYGLL